MGAFLRLLETSFCSLAEGIPSIKCAPTLQVYPQVFYDKISRKLHFSWMERATISFLKYLLEWSCHNLHCTVAALESEMVSIWDLNCSE